jgi:hypothetical protein
MALALVLALTLAPAASAAAEAPAAVGRPGKPAKARRRKGACGVNPGAYAPPGAAARQHWSAAARAEWTAASAVDRLQRLEAAWAATDDACFLLFASRFNNEAGHFVRAYNQSRQLLDLEARQVPADAAVEAEAYVKGLDDGTLACEVEVQVLGDRGPGGEVVDATYRGIDASSDQVVTDRIAVDAAGAARRLLRIGTWVFELADPALEFASAATAEGDSPRRRVLFLDDCPAPLRLELRRRPAPPPVDPTPKPPQSPPGEVTPPPGKTGPDRPPPVAAADMRTLGNVGVGVGAGLAVVGGVIVGVGARQWYQTCPSTIDLHDTDAQDATDRCRGQIGSPTHLRSAGAGLLGAGVGLLVPAAILRRSTPDRRAVWLPIAGGVSAAAGLAMLAGGVVRFDRSFGGDADHTTADPTWGSRPTVALHSVGAAFTGLGVGLLGASLARYVWRTRSAPARRHALELGPMRLPAGAAVVLSGRF